MGNRSDWERLAELLGADEDAGLVLHGIEVRGGAVNESLLDGLDDSGAIAFLRVDDGGGELADALAQLPRVFAAGVDLDRVADVDDLEPAVEVADGLLASAGLRLVRLVDAGDSVPLAVVVGEALSEMSEIAGRLGVQVATLR